MAPKVTKVVPSPAAKITKTKTKAAATSAAAGSGSASGSGARIIKKPASAAAAAASGKVAPKKVAATGKAADTKKVPTASAASRTATSSSATTAAASASGSAGAGGGRQFTRAEYDAINARIDAMSEEELDAALMVDDEDDLSDADPDAAAAATANSKESDDDDDDASDGDEDDDADDGAALDPAAVKAKADADAARAKAEAVERRALMTRIAAKPATELARVLAASFETTAPAAVERWRAAVASLAADEKFDILQFVTATLCVCAVGHPLDTSETDDTVTCTACGTNKRNRSEVVCSECAFAEGVCSRCSRVVRLSTLERTEVGVAALLVVLCEPKLFAAARAVYRDAERTAHRAAYRKAFERRAAIEARKQQKQLSRKLVDAFVQKAENITLKLHRAKQDAKSNSAVTGTGDKKATPSIAELEKELAVALARVSMLRAKYVAHTKELADLEARYGVVDSEADDSDSDEPEAAAAKEALYADGMRMQINHMIKSCIDLPPQAVAPPVSLATRPKTGSARAPLTAASTATATAIATASAHATAASPAASKKPTK